MTEIVYLSHCSYLFVLWVIIDHFKTPIGVVNLQISAVDADIQHGLFTEIKSAGHIIKLFRFDSVKNWLSDDFTVEDSLGWIFYVKKTNGIKETLDIICELEPGVCIESSTDSGEHLDAVWIESSSHFLSIGTEDNEMLGYRAHVNDYMPKRLEEYLKNRSFIEYLDLGFKAQIPDLAEGEFLYFHFLTAINSRKKSKFYPEEDDISTNFAVDYSKNALIKRLNVPFKVD